MVNYGPRIPRNVSPPGRDGRKPGDFPKHRAWVRSQPCAIEGKVGHFCGGRVQCAHVRNGTELAGVGRKPSDIWTLPLCATGHQVQHNIGEAAFQKRYGIDMKELAASYWKRSPYRSMYEDEAA